MLLRDGEGIERRFIPIVRANLGRLSGLVVTGHVKVHDGIVLVAGFFVPARAGNVINGARGVHMKERRRKKPQQNRQACVSCKGPPHGSYC